MNKANNNQPDFFPKTRYMGSKEKLLPYLGDIFKSIEFETCIDLMSGTSVVSYLLKSMNKEVISNDFLKMNYYFSKATIENSFIKLNDEDIDEILLEKHNSGFIYEKFRNLYYSDEDTIFIENTLNNIITIKDQYKKSIAYSSLIRACIKKRPRGIFAYTGLRYNDNRPDLKKSLKEHFIENISIFNSAVFDNGKQNVSRNLDCMQIKEPADLIYIDPPYFSPLSDNDYTRRYHFVEGIARNWEGVEIQEKTKTKKFKSYKSPFSSLSGTIEALENIFNIYKSSNIILSYSSNSLPGKDDIYSLMRKYKNNVDIVAVDYTYSFANQASASKVKNKVKEYIFIGK